MKALLLSFGLSLLTVAPVACRAQAARLTVPGPVSSHFTADFQPTDSPDSTTFCAETTFRDSLYGVTRVYYPSGQLRQYIPYADVRRLLLYGTLSTWYEDGRMRSKEDYVAGQRDGELLTFYPDGTPKRREQYKAGRGSVGTCYGPDGAQVPFFAYEQLPLYPGGQEQLTRELARGVRLNSKEAEAMRRESARQLARGAQSWKRKVYVELVVTEEGRVTNAQVVQSNAPFLNGAALRSATMLKRQFLPARRDGEVVRSHYTVPVDYTLEQPYQRPTSTMPMSSRPMGRW
ncbi:MAG: hypothetical protein JWR44_1100 [Hymenobacter sp.]|jgi:protein TonB|nr:hypothetical protein [Hymenobacter sp.]